MSDELRHKSTMAEHPDVREVLPVYLGRLRGIVGELRRLYAGGESEKLRIVVHQLRGAGGSYGFEGMTVLAGGVEERILGGASSADVGVALDALIGYVERIEGY